MWAGMWKNISIYNQGHIQDFIDTESNFPPGHPHLWSSVLYFLYISFISLHNMFLWIMDDKNIVINYLMLKPLMCVNMDWGHDVSVINGSKY